MNRENDSRLRESLENVSAESLIPGFDKAALWTRIEPRVKQRAPTRISLLWLTHAAAVAAGLLLVWMLLPRTTDSTRESVARIAATEKRILPKESSAPVASPVFPEKVASERNRQGGEKRAERINRRGASEAPFQTKSPAASPRNSTDEKQPVQSAVAQLHTPALPPSSLAARDSSTPKISTASKQPPPVVMHLLDVRGESGERLRRPVEPLPARRMGFFARLFSRNKVPDLTGTAASDAMVQRTYLSR